MPALPPPILAPSPNPLETTALAFCRTLAARSTLEVGGDPAKLGILRKQAEALEAICKGTLPADGRVLPLVEAALGALETGTGSGETGERRFGGAALVLARRWRSTLGNGQADPARSLQALEGLELLYGFAGLRAVPYRLQALHLRVDRSREVDPVLEKDLKAAVEDHYGPFLTPVEMEPLLETSRMLVDVWMRRRDDAALTRRVRELGLVSQASRVWRVVAKGASASLRLDLAALVGRLQPRVLLAPGPEMEDVVMEWAEALFKARVALAGCCALDPQRLDRCQMALLQFLEGFPSLGPEGASQAKEFPLILGIRLWRDERLDEILSLFPRFLALLKHYDALEDASPVGGDGKVGQILTLLERAARLQGRIRAAGLL